MHADRQEVCMQTVGMQVGSRKAVCREAGSGQRGRQWAEMQAVGREAGSE